MNLSELKKVKRTLTQSRKLEVIEELAFDDANSCHKEFKKTGSLPHVRAAYRGWYVTMASVKNKARYTTVSDEN